MTIFVLVYCFRIQRYAVIPLSTNSGLLGWVPHCDTLHTLIRDYREKKKILLNIEHRIMLRVNLFRKQILSSDVLYSHFLCDRVVSKFLEHIFDAFVR